jgi:hypothetical protein
MEYVPADLEGLVTPARYQAAVRSTARGEPDNLLVARWVVDFVMGQVGTEWSEGA